MLVPVPASQDGLQSQGIAVPQGQPGPQSQSHPSPTARLGTPVPVPCHRQGWTSQCHSVPHTQKDTKMKARAGYRFTVTLP